MAQHDYNLADALGSLFRGDLNGALAAIVSRNSSPTTAPSNPPQGMVYVKTVSATVHEVWEYDGGSWVLRYIINPTTHEFRSVDGNRRQWGGLAGGTADALTISTTPSIAAYEDGQRFVLYTGAGANTGAMTLNVDSAGQKAIKINGADPAAGDVPANSLLVVQYRANIMHVVGGALPRATTGRYGHVLLDSEAGFLAATAGKVPTSDVVKKHARERLQANRTYYVRSDGSDSNTGLANDAAGAFATIQKAWNVISQTLDLAGYTVTVQIGDGTYTAGLSASGQVVGQGGTANVVFQGNSGTPANVVINVTGGDCFSVTARAAITVKDLELRTTTSGDCLQANSNSAIAFSNVRFGACAGNHIISQYHSLISASGSYAIVGAAPRHFFATGEGSIVLSATLTVTLTGTPAFSSQFARSSNNALIYCDSGAVTFSGAATGVRYSAVQGGGIDTEGGGASYLPGNSAGSATSPGWYA